MPVTHTVIRQYQDQSSNALRKQESVTGNAELNLHDDALAVVANHQYHMAFTRANLQSLCISASGAVTVYTNNPSGSSPQDTIAIAAGQVLIWTLGIDGLSKCPFSADVTTVYVTNAGSGSVSFDIRCVVNQ